MEHNSNKSAEYFSSGVPTVAQMLGEMTWVMSQSPTHKHFAIGDLEWMAMPALLLEQFRIFYGDTTPVGFALWAHLSQEAEERMQAQIDSGRGARLRPDDWKSGDRPWLVDLVVPFSAPGVDMQKVMVTDLMSSVFKGRTIKMHSFDHATQKLEIKEVAG